MRQQVRGHKGTVAVSANADAIAIGNPHLDSFVDGSFRARDNLLDVGVVHRLRIADHRHGGVIENGIALCQQPQLTHAVNYGEAIWRAAYLAGGESIVELQRISPHNGRQWRALLVSGWEIKFERKLHAIIALIGDQLLGDAMEGRRRIGESRELYSLVVTRGTHKIIWRVLRRFVASQETRSFSTKHRNGLLINFLRAAEDALCLQGGGVKAIKKWPIALIARADTSQVNRVAVLQDHAMSVRQLPHDRRAGIVVAILR